MGKRAAEKGAWPESSAVGGHLQVFMVENTVAGNTALPGGAEIEWEGEGRTMKSLEMYTAKQLHLHLTSPHQICALVGQSVVLGYLSDYFSVEEPTAEQTRDAYLFAAGGWQSLNMFDCSGRLHNFVPSFSSTTFQLWLYCHW